MPTKPVEFHDDAGAEYDAAFDWYLKRSADAALNFDAEMNRALADITTAPQRWAAGPQSTRRYLLRRFPFVLVYREQGKKYSNSGNGTHQPQTGILEAATKTVAQKTTHFSSRETRGRETRVSGFRVSRLNGANLRQ